MRVKYFFWLILFPVFALSQNEGKKYERKLYFSTLFNAGVLYTDKREAVKYDGYFLKQDLERTYKSGSSVNLSLGISYLLTKKWMAEGYIGVNRTEYGYSEKGLTSYKGGVALPYTFYGRKEYTYIHRGVTLTGGVTFHDPMLSRLKIYFSNYLNYHWVLRTKEYVFSVDETNNMSYKSKFTSRAPRHIFYSTHLVGLKINTTARSSIRPGIGFNLYINNHYKFYYNPIINLTIII